MTKTKRDGPPLALPTREEILAFLAREEQAMRETGRAAKIGKREIARAFSIKGADRVELKRLISGLVEEGALDRRRGP
ncbi:MAG: hypothetical protein WBS22_10505, partial [Methylocystis sp.]